MPVDQDSLPKRGLVSRLTKLFSSKRLHPSGRKAEPKAERNHSIYLGDVLDDSGSILCEAGPMPLDQRTRQMLERYRCEARVATQISEPSEVVEQTAEASGQVPAFPGSVSEIQPDNAPAPKSTDTFKRGLEEQGIAEVLDDRAIRMKYGHSPLSTLSSIGGVYEEPQAPAQVPGHEQPPNHLYPQQSSFHNFLFLDSMASEQEMQAALMAGYSQQSTPPPVAIDSGGTAESVAILDTWDDALFGPAGKLLGPAEAGAAPVGQQHRSQLADSAARTPDTKKRPSSLLTSDSSASKRSSCESPSSQNRESRSPLKQQRKADWTSGARSLKLGAAQMAAARPEVLPSGGQGAQSGGFSDAIKTQNLSSSSTKPHAQAVQQQSKAANTVNPAADPDIRRIAEALDKPPFKQAPSSAASGSAVQALKLPQTAAHITWKGDRSDGNHPRQQRREARQREKEKALLQVQEQSFDQQRHIPAAQRLRTAPAAGFRTEPLQDVTGKQANHEASAKDYGKKPQKQRAQTAAQRPAKPALSSKYVDFDASLNARLEAYDGVPNLMDETDTSPEHSQALQKPHEPAGKPKPLRRVHFTDERISAEAPKAAPRPKVADPAGLRSGSKAVPAGQQRGLQKPMQISLDGTRMADFWSDDNQEDVLAEAMALSASLSQEKEANAPGGPLGSPSRFFQLTSQPTEDRELPQGGHIPAWDAQVRLHMGYAKTLSGGKHPQQNKAANRKLQCISNGLQTQPTALQGQQHQTHQPLERPQVTVTVKPKPNPLEGPAPMNGANNRPHKQHNAVISRKSRAQKPPLHQATHSSTNMLMKAAAAKADPAAAQALHQPHNQVQSSFAAARRAILQAEARQRPVLTSSKTGPAWANSSRDWEQSTITSCMPEESMDLESYPVSVPPSPGSLASLHGHALSHVTYSPGRGQSSMWSSSAPAEPWVPDVQSVAEGDENEGCNTRSMAEMSALSFRPGLATEPSTRLTEAFLENRAVLDTVACDVDLAFTSSMWPEGHTPSTVQPTALDSERFSGPRYHPDAESILTPPANGHYGMGQRSLLHSVPSDYVYARHSPIRQAGWR